MNRDGGGVVNGIVDGSDGCSRNNRDGFLNGTDASYTHCRAGSIEVRHIVGRRNDCAL
jgi:hypothetical protein